MSFYRFQRELPGTTITPFLAIPLPSDSTFSMEVYGGQTNQVCWKIMTNLGDSLAEYLLACMRLFENKN